MRICTIAACVVMLVGCGSGTNEGPEPLPDSVEPADTLEDTTPVDTAAPDIGIDTSVPDLPQPDTDTPTEPEENFVVVKDGVVVLDEEGGGALVEKQEDGTLVFDADAEVDLQPDTVLFAGPDDGAIYAKVVSTHEEDGLVYVETEVPQLDEVFSEANVRQELVVNFDGVEFEGLLADQVELRTEGKADSFDLPVINIPFSGFSVVAMSGQDDFGDPMSINVEVVNGYWSLEPQILFGFDIALLSGNLEYLQLGVSYKTTLHLELGVNVSGNLGAWTYDGDPFLTMKPLRVKFLWPVPGWIDLSGAFSWVAEISVQGSLEATGGLEVVFDTTLGAEYADGSWQSLADKTQSYQKIGPEIQAAFSYGAKVGVDADFGVEPYSVAGPHVYLQPYAAFEADLLEGPIRLLWKILFGIEAGVGFDVHLLDWALVNFEKKLFDWSATVAEGEIPLDEPCVPDCGENQCGDDGCEGSCGDCLGPQELCVEGQCVCQPDCEGKECGEDGCGGVCDTCMAPDQCVDGNCVCEPVCGVQVCSLDPVCGMSCGICNDGTVCVEGACVVPGPVCPDDKDCSVLECGPDPICSVECGPCELGFACDAGSCIEEITCGNDVCDPDEDYATCPADCECIPDCEGKECGPDGCGDACDECDPGFVCVDGDCVEEGPTCPEDIDCSGLECGPDPVCGVSCDICGVGESCEEGQCTGGSCWPDCGEEVHIPAGTFWMGCNEVVDTNCKSDEYPYHEVYLDAYYIDVTEVTNSMFAEFLNATNNDLFSVGCNDSTPKLLLNDGTWSFENGKEANPVTHVKWTEAQEYCEWAGKRLCTEAEWEKAARGIDGPKYPWGNDTITCYFAVLYQTGEGGGPGCATWDSMPVCSKSPQGDSPYGACDMVGNVWEWVSDWYYDDYYSTTPVSNPLGPESGSHRVYRGGGFANAYYNQRASARWDKDPSDCNGGLGFRCCSSD